jgi:hypothetical protein
LNFVKALRKIFCIEILIDLIALWQESSLVEASESTICPQASIGARVVVTSNNAAFQVISFAKLSQVEVGIESSVGEENTETREDALDIARCCPFTGKDTLLILGYSCCRNAKLSNAFLASVRQIFTSFHNIVS